jgi:myosin-crossreactive antigen
MFGDAESAETYVQLHEHRDEESIHTMGMGCRDLATYVLKIHEGCLTKVAMRHTEDVITEGDSQWGAQQTTSGHISTRRGRRVQLSCRWRLSSMAVLVELDLF